MASQDNSKVLLNALDCAESALQDYIVFVTETPKKDLFGDGVESGVFKVTLKGEQKKIKLALVDRDYMFDFNKDDYTKEETESVQAVLTFCLKSLMSIYPIVLHTLDIKKIVKKDILIDSKIIVDPKNTTAIIYSASRDVRDLDKRIGFIWAT